MVPTTLIAASLLPLLLSVIRRFASILGDPELMLLVGGIYVISYYFVSAIFLSKASDGSYRGAWRKNGPIDIATSLLWCFTALAMIVSLLGLLATNQLSLPHLLGYYALFIFLFAFVYNLLEWHFPGSIKDLTTGWSGELQSVLLSIQVMTSTDLTSARPKKSLVQVFAAIEALLGVLFVAVFIAKAVNLLP